MPPAPPPSAAPSTVAGLLVTYGVDWSGNVPYTASALAAETAVVRGRIDATGGRAFHSITSPFPAVIDGFGVPRVREGTTLDTSAGMAGARRPVPLPRPGGARDPRYATRLTNLARS